jgi:hydroxyquinol 1,2-dioxygenase
MARLGRPGKSMRNVDIDNITEAVTASFANSENDRLKEIVGHLVAHLHAFARESRLTQAEWMRAIEFLAACGRKSTVERNEFILLSDVLGISSIVDLINQQSAGTEASAIGPFYRNDSKSVSSGADLRRNTPGLPVIVRGRVVDAAERGLGGAILDVWSNARNGLYPAQDPHQDPHNLRAKVVADEAGRYCFVSVPPEPYQVPTDGPVGDLLRAGARRAWRPAHFHFMVGARGHASVVTEIFIEGDPYLESDAVFGVRHSLVRPMRRCEERVQGIPDGIDPPHFLLDADFQLELLSR